MPQTKFFLAAACLMGVTTFVNAATIFPTSPLIQIGDDTDIFFTGSLSFDLKDNLYSVAAKKSAAVVTFVPGLNLQYAKDSPLSVNLTASQSIIRYNKAEFKDLEQGNSIIAGSINCDTGGPLVIGLSTSYGQSARNDNLATVLGVDSGQVLGATLVRQANYSHSLSVGYKLTEKLSLNVSFINSYNDYLNPIKTKSNIVDSAPPNDTYEHIANNTNTLSEINTKSIPINITYKTPNETLTYGLSLTHTQSDYSNAPYFHTRQILDPVTNLPTGPILDVARPPGAKKFTQNFFGFTVNGEPTSSGKIHITTRLGYFTSDLDGVSQNGVSYDLKISHNLTEKFTHEINLIHDVSASPAGGSIKSDTMSYTLAYALSERASLRFVALNTKADTGSAQIDTIDFNAGMSWEYNKYIKLDATVDVLDSKVRNSPSANFKANSFNLSTTFRY
jgi:hypothetical protein